MLSDVRFLFKEFPSLPLAPASEPGCLSGGDNTTDEKNRRMCERGGLTVFLFYPDEGQTSALGRLSVIHPCTTCIVYEIFSQNAAAPQ